MNPGNRYASRSRLFVNLAIPVSKQVLEPSKSQNAPVNTGYNSLLCSKTTHSSTRRARDMSAVVRDAEIGQLMLAGKDPAAREIIEQGTRITARDEHPFPSFTRSILPD